MGMEQSSLVRDGRGRDGKAERLAGGGTGNSYRRMTAPSHPGPPFRKKRERVGHPPIRMLGARGKGCATRPAADSALGASTGVDALEKGADWVAESPWAQGQIRQFLRSQGVKWSVKHVSKDAAWLGKWAGRVGGALATYSAYERYQKCRGY